MSSGKRQSPWHACKSPDRQTRLSLSAHFSPPPTSQATCQLHPSPVDSSNLPRTVLRPSPRLFPLLPLLWLFFAWLNSSAEMSPSVPSGSHRLCYVLLLHFCSPRTHPRIFLQLGRCQILLYLPHSVWEPTQVQPRSVALLCPVLPAPGARPGTGLSTYQSHHY